MRADTDDFKNQFKDKNVEAFSYTKSGASADDEIDALSGATLTTNAVTNGVNAGIFCFNYCNESNRHGHALNKRNQKVGKDDSIGNALCRISLARIFLAVV